jgi:hypothetical protein
MTVHEMQHLNVLTTTQRRVFLNQPSQTLEVYPSHLLLYTIISDRSTAEGGRPIPGNHIGQQQEQVSFLTLFSKPGNPLTLLLILLTLSHSSNFHSFDVQQCKRCFLESRQQLPPPSTLSSAGKSPTEWMTYCRWRDVVVVVQPSVLCSARVICQREVTSRSPSNTRVGIPPLI